MAQHKKFTLDAIAKASVATVDREGVEGLKPGPYLGFIAAPGGAQECEIFITTRLQKMQMWVPWSVLPWLPYLVRSLAVGFVCFVETPSECDGSAQG